MTVRANITRMPLRVQRKFVPKREGGGGEKGREGETNRLSIFTEMDPLWLIKQVEHLSRQVLDRQEIFILTVYSVFHTDVIKVLCT